MPTINVNLDLVATAGGTVDVITATYSPAPPSLHEGLLLFFAASGVNTSTTPTFNPNGLGAKTIVKRGGKALLAGDIPRANYVCAVVYNLANTRWELLNPGTLSEAVNTGKTASFEVGNNIFGLGHEGGVFYYSRAAGDEKFYALAANAFGTTELLELGYKKFTTGQNNVVSITDTGVELSVNDANTNPYPGLVITDPEGVTIQSKDTGAVNCVLRCLDAGTGAYDGNVLFKIVNNGNVVIPGLGGGGTKFVQVDNNGVLSTTASSGGLTPPVTYTVRVVTAAGAVTVATSDYVVVVNKTVGAATTVNLPAGPTTGHTYIIKDGKGDCVTNNITIDPDGVTTIDGSSTYILNENYGSITVVYNGSEWNII